MKKLKLEAQMGFEPVGWVTAVLSNVGPFVCDDPQTKVDLVNKFKQRASMSINQRALGRGVQKVILNLSD